MYVGHFEKKFSMLTNFPVQQYFTFNAFGVQCPILRLIPRNFEVYQRNLDVVSLQNLGIKCIIV